MPKGTILDLPVIVIMLFALGVSIFFGYKLLLEFISGTEGYLNPSNIALLERGKTAMQVFNYGFLFITVGFGIGAIIGAFMLDTHPIFLPFSIMMFIIFLFITAQFTNVFYEIASLVEFTAVTDAFPVIVTVFKNLPLILAVFGVIMLIVMFGKWRLGGEVSE
jgi:hypothetical protein